MACTNDTIIDSVSYTQMVTPPKSHFRQDIQSLRALAIIFVLLFHMWPSQFRLGFLGVDMFFVISGYLIFMLLSRKKPINSVKTLDFYFRRIKRIVPIYLFIVACVLIGILQLLSPIEFKQIVSEALPALGFYSNMPGSRPFNYFDLSSKLYFFLHTCVEVQFYLVVPILFAMSELLCKVRPALQLILVCSIPLISFCFQILFTGDSSHMLLSARLWQFFAGFAAHFAYENRTLNFVKNGTEAKNHKRQIADNCVTMIAYISLCLLFVFGFNLHTQLSRFIVVMLTALLVGRCNGTSAFLTNKPIVTIGDVSYSIYLIHWPMFTAHLYLNADMYEDGQEADLKSGVVLICASIILGYVAESCFKFVLKQICSWKFLFAVLFFGYCLNGILLFQLNSKAVNLDDDISKEIHPGLTSKFKKNIIMLWNRRSNMTKYTNDQIMALNSELRSPSRGLSFCDSRDKTMPTNFHLDLNSYDADAIITCHKKGNGTKNIVVIGNSHAIVSYAGIAYIFRDVYKNLVFIARSSCIPASREFQQPGRTDAVKDECVRLLNETMLAFQQWREPIEIIISLFAVVSVPDTSLPTDIKTDKFLNSMQSFYTELGKIPTEALLLYSNFPMFTKKAYFQVAEQLKSGEPLNNIGDTKNKLLSRLPSLRARTELVQCEKCIQLKLIDFWCSLSNENFCHSAQSNGLIYFTDSHHPSALGSFFNAQYMKERYMEFIQRKSA